MNTLKRVVVVDNLTETFKGDIVRSGLQKSSKLDARAFSRMGYDTHYVYCGECIDRTYSYVHHPVDTHGSKERAVLDGKNPARASKTYILNSLKKIQFLLRGADYIIVHCHSVTMLNGVDSLVKDKKIMFVIHDVIDLMWCYGFSSAVRKLRSSGRNRVYIATNSNYSIQRMNDVYARAKEVGYELPLSGDEAFDGYIDHFVWTDENVTPEQIGKKEAKSAVIGRYESSKYHHKVYGYSNPLNKIIHYGIKDPRRDEGLKYYNRLIKNANGYMENLSDKDLFNSICSSQSIILPCFHEGFGYTAFEAGIYGVCPVIFKKKLEHINLDIHATAEYLDRAGCKYFIADFNDKDSINEAIDKSLTITDDDRISIHTSLLNYFTVEKYVSERIDKLDSITTKIENNENTLLNFL